MVFLWMKKKVVILSIIHSNGSITVHYNLQKVQFWEVALFAAKSKKSISIEKHLKNAFEIIVHICYCTIFPFLEYFVAVVHHRCYSNTAAQMSSPKDTPIVNGVLDMYFKIELGSYLFLYVHIFC